MDALLRSAKIMLVIIIVGFLASLSFRKELVSQNRSIPAIWLRPIFIGLIIIPQQSRNQNYNERRRAIDGKVLV